MQIFLDSSLPLSINTKMIINYRSHHISNKKTVKQIPETLCHVFKDFFLGQAVQHGMMGDVSAGHITAEQQMPSKPQYS